MIGMVYAPKNQPYSRDYNPIATLAVVSVIILSLGIAFRIVSSEKRVEENYILVDIENGDTVWNIVRDLYDDEAEIRGVVSDTLKINGIADGVIHPGMTIRIPKTSRLLSAGAASKI